MKYNIITLLLLLGVLILQSPLSADCISEEDSFLFRMKVKDKQFQEASEELERLSSKCPDNTKLELLETELWIEKGEDLYQRKQFKSAFPYYKNAYSRWRTNPIVKQKYNELSGKILTDEPEIIPIQRKINTTVKEEKEILTLPLTQIEPAIWEDKEKWFEHLKTLEERVWILTLIAGVSIGFHIVFGLSFIFSFLNKK